MFPEIFAEISAKTFYVFDVAFDSQYDNFSLRTKPVAGKGNFVGCLSGLEDGDLFVFGDFDLWEERFTKMAFFE